MNRIKVSRVLPNKFIIRWCNSIGGLDVSNCVIVVYSYHVLLLVHEVFVVELTAFFN